MFHTSAATSRIMRICTCLHKCACITTTLHSAIPYTTYARAYACKHVHLTITIKKHAMETIQENAPQRKLAHRSMTMIITLAKITVDTIMHKQLSIVINVIIVIVFIIVIISSSSKNMPANQSSSSPPSPQTASTPSFFHHHNHNRHHHNFQETLVTSRQRKHQRGKKNAAYQCQTKPIKTKIRFNKIKHAPHQNFTHHTSQSRFNAIAIAIAAKSNSGIRLQFVNNMHNSNKKRG